MAENSPAVVTGIVAEASRGGDKERPNLFGVIEEVGGFQRLEVTAEKILYPVCSHGHGKHV
jgi:hypothetical protein